MSKPLPIASPIPTSAPPLPGNDPRGLQGILARGNPIYQGGARLGPENSGRPRNPTPFFSNGGTITPQLMQAIQRRLSGYTQRAADKSAKRWTG